MIVIDPKQVMEAWARIGRTDDGRLARLLLVDMLMAGLPTGVKGGALREAAGRQRLARELLNLMDANADGRPAARPTDDAGVTLARISPERDGGERGSRRRVPERAVGDEA